MKAYRTITTVTDSGELVLRDIPFETGERVEVVVRPPTEDRQELLQRLDQLLKETQSLPQVQGITEQDIADEISKYRAGE
jgi:hypothetical protein